MDINNFINPDDIRPYCQKPFNIGDRTIATTGNTMLSIPKIDGYEECDSESFKERVLSILDGFNNMEYSPLPEIVLPEKVTCTVCEGTKKAITNICPECDGVGEVDAETDYNTYQDLECKTCNGDGRETTTNTDEDCSKCNGTGETLPLWSPVDILGLKINLDYLNYVIGEDNLKASADVGSGILYLTTGENKILILALNQ